MKNMIGLWLLPLMLIISFSSEARSKSSKKNDNNYEYSNSKKDKKSSEDKSYSYKEKKDRRDNNDYEYKSKDKKDRKDYNDYGYKNKDKKNDKKYDNKGNDYSGYKKEKTIPLKKVRPGDTRTRADGTFDKVHKDGKGYTHTYTDSRGNLRKESIRYNKYGKEVKMSDTERKSNGDVITRYKSGISEVRTHDGLRYQEDRYGKTIYKERKDTWNNRPVIYREYRNNYKTVYVQNYYYGSPVYFYRPSLFDDNYYSYTLRTWNRPVHYTWGWNYIQRYPRYHYYYRPYVSYYSPAYWLTDYLIMSLIQANYERVASNADYADDGDEYDDYDNNDNDYRDSNNQATLSEAVKEEIRKQVELALRNQQQAVKNNSTMEPSQILTEGRLMVVHADLNVEDQSGNQCQLDEGDVVRILSQPSTQNPTAQLKVVSAKGTSCAAGTTLTISSTNLLEMENEFQSRIQQGMSEMQKNKVGNN